MYHSNIFPDLTVNGGNFGSLSGQGFNSLPGAASVDIISNAPFQFISATDGTWCAALSCSGDSGVNGQWSVTPLPAALPLFASGLVGLVLLGWRRKKKAIAA